MKKAQDFHELLMQCRSAGVEFSKKADLKRLREVPNTGYWIHFTLDNREAADWLRRESGVEPHLVDILLAEKVRPRLLSQNDALLLILRVADTSEASEYEELRSLRIYSDGKRIISTSIYPIPAVRAMLKRWSEPRTDEVSISDFLIDLVIESVRGLEAILEDLDEGADVIEQQLIRDEWPNDDEIALMAQDALGIRRCLAPQREVSAQLWALELSWLNESHTKKLRELHEWVARQFDEAEVLRDRIRLIREQYMSYVAEQSNRRLYLFSVVAVIFLPLSFLTGLFGVNLSGIPWAESPQAFIAFCASLILLSMVMLAAFRRVGLL